MRAKSMVLILIALGCGLVASIAISQVMERGANSGNAMLETVQIYVASADIDANDQLSASNVRVEDWPKSKVPEGATVNFDEIAERFARVRFYEGEPILQAKLANGIDGPAIKIPEGFRVCSLKVQMDTAVSGLVNPGDRVDIFGYFRKNQDVPKTGTREILRNVRVFAVNSETEQETDPEGKQIAAKTVSVLVPYEQVAKLMLATELGTLRLALRRPNETIESASAENANIESLFGGRSEDADNDSNESSPPSSQLASAAGGFAKFLSGLKNTNTALPAASMSTDTQPTGPVWEMTVLTPDGGMQFTWDHEQGMPQQGMSVSTMPAATAASGSLPPANALRPAPATEPDTNTNHTDADGVSPAEPPVAEPQQDTAPDEQNSATDNPISDD